MTATVPTVTDHALVRYLERVRGFSFNRERSEIAYICRGIENGVVRLNGLSYGVHDGVVVSIVPGRFYPQRATGRRKTEGVR